MALRLTRTRTVALVAAVLVCAVAVWIWRDPMAPLRNGLALQGWWIDLSARQVEAGGHRWVYDEHEADDPAAPTVVLVHGFTGGKEKGARQAEVEAQWASFARDNYAKAKAKAEEALKAAR